LKGEKVYQLQVYKHVQKSDKNNFSLHSVNSRTRPESKFTRIYQTLSKLIIWFPKLSCPVTEAIEMYYK